MKIKAAIYARYSSDKQRETSIDDQIRRCQELAQRHNLDVPQCIRQRYQGNALGRTS